MGAAHPNPCRCLIMPEDPSFADLLGRLRRGENAAAAVVVDRYARRLIALARAHLDRRILRKEDPEDVLQSVFKSFFQRCGAGQFRLDSRDDLWSLLVSLTLHKCGHRADYFRAARRDIKREAGEPGPMDVSRQEWEALAREPTPPEGVLLAETVERLLDGLEPHQKQIVQLSLEGEAPARIATRVGVTQRTVQRVLKGVRARLERWQEEESDENRRAP
jgi:RNA polymerase sigma-70 factor (ECF subfamily)